MNDVDLHDPTRIPFGKGRIADLNDQVPAAPGCGSVIDAARFIPAAALHDGDPWEILTSRGSVVTAAMPIGTVPTLPATGSEMNPGSAITNPDRGAKLPFLSPHVYPVFSVLDPVLTFTLPARQVANGVADPFVHDVRAPEIDTIVTALEDHGMTALGEHGAIAPADARRILEAAA